MTNEIESLVFDALYDRVKSDSGNSCLVENTAGVQLVRSSVDALPVLEAVLTETVEPAIIRASGWQEGSEWHQTPMLFRGLDYVLGAYLVIGAKHSPERVVSFVRQLSPPMTAAAITAIPTFFRRVRNGYNFDIAPSDEYWRLIDECAESHYSGLRVAARTAKQVLSAQDTN